MRILTRRHGQKNWYVLESTVYRAEAQLQQLLAESPSLIPVGEIRGDASELTSAIRELGLPGSGSTDIVAFSAQGDIALVECKLAGNPEIKRKVIGQIIEYGAYLWGMSYEELDRLVSSRAGGKSLAEQVREAFGSPDWDEEAFRAGIAETLTKGSFMMVIAVDEINDELARTISFLNGCGRPAFSFHALEMRRFGTEGFEVLVPHLHGPPIQDGPTKKPERTKWTKERFLQTVQTGLPSNVAEVIKDLYGWSETNADRVWPGSGAQYGSFTFHYLKAGRTVSVFTVYTYGSFSLNYGWLKDIVDADLLEEFHGSITSIPSFGRVPHDFSKYPELKINEALVDQPGALEGFKGAVLRLGEGVRS